MNYKEKLFNITNKIKEDTSNKEKIKSDFSKKDKKKKLSDSERIDRIEQILGIK